MKKFFTISTKKNYNRSKWYLIAFIEESGI